MKCKDAPRSTQIGLIFLAMSTTFLTVFSIISLGLNTKRAKDGKPVQSSNPESLATIPSISMAPNSIAPTTLITPSSKDPTSIHFSTIETSTVAPTSIRPTSISPTTITPSIEEPNKPGKCPRNPAKSYKMEWGLLGNIIQGKVAGILWRQLITISHNGTRVVMGSPWGIYWFGTSRVEVLNYDGNGWKEEDSFQRFSWNAFGAQTSLSGDGKTLAIAAYWGDEKGADSGHVEIYESTEKAGWKQKGDKLVGLQAGDWFGNSVSLSQDGNQIAIGSPGSDLNGNLTGSTHIFEFDGSNWFQLGKVIYGEAKGDQFGRAVSLSADGSIVAIGASYSGSVQVFHYAFESRKMKESNPNRSTQSAQERQWLPIGEKLVGQTSDDRFGYSLSINAKGDTVAVGTELGNYVQVFDLDGKKWKQMGETLVGTNRFGYSVSLSANIQRVAVGPYDEGGGYVRVYDFNGDDWIEVGGNVTSSTPEQYFGAFVSLSSCGDQLAVGYIYDDGLSDHGRVKIYELS